MKKHILTIFQLSISLTHAYLNIPSKEKKKYAIEKKGWEKNNSTLTKTDEKWDHEHHI